MEEKKEENLNCIERQVRLLGQGGAMNRMSIMASDLLRSAPTTTDIDDLLDFLMLIKSEIKKGLFGR